MTRPELLTGAMLVAGHLLMLPAMAAVMLLRPTGTPTTTEEGEGTSTDGPSNMPADEVGPAVRSAAWSALAVGLLYVAVSAYWALGGTAGLNTIGGELEEMARAIEPLVVVAIWVVVAGKIVGAALAVMLLRAGSRSWRRLLLVVTWIAGCVLALYGGVLVAGQALVVTGVIQASPDADWTAIYSRLYLWDPWFLLWGLLLLIVAIGATQRGTPTAADPAAASRR